MKSPICAYLSRQFLRISTRTLSRWSDLISPIKEEPKHITPSAPLPLTELPVEATTFHRSLRPRITCSLARESSEQVWLETLKNKRNEKIGIIDLHPDVFGTLPRLDIIMKNLTWQRKYRIVDYRCITTRAEITYRTNKRPWPQKGTGKARHGDRKSPLWVGGGQAKGPRGPDSYFYILPKPQRLLGLTSMLSARYHQNDLRVVDNFDVPTADPDYMLELIDMKRWGLSVLFVHETDEAPLDLARIAAKIPHVNVMPVYGLNVWSIAKHDTLVLSENSLDILEEKLLYHLALCDHRSAVNPVWNEPVNTHYSGWPFPGKSLSYD